MSHFRGAWQSLNFYKEYLFGFETLVFATSGILSMHKQHVTLQRERKTSLGYVCNPSSSRERDAVSGDAMGTPSA